MPLEPDVNGGKPGESFDRGQAGSVGDGGVGFRPVIAGLPEFVPRLLRGGSVDREE